MGKPASISPEQSELEHSLRQLRESLPQCLVTALLDRRDSRLLGLSAAPGYETSFVDLVASASGEFFQALPGSHEISLESVSEVVTASPELFHVFLRCPHAPESTLVAICRASVHLGMVMTTLRVLAETVDGREISGTWRHS